jgi:CRISPR system Cascade subunit CasB
MGESVVAKRNQIEEFLDYLAARVEDRGMMADLRHGLSRSTEYRAWPHIVPWCRRFEDDRERRIWLTTAAGFAMHQRTSDSGNMGTSLRHIAKGDGRGQEGLSTFDARFRRLLACSSASEVCDHLGGVLRASERKDVPINFAQLFTDLECWGEGVKVRWAAEFYWGAEPEEAGTAAAEEEIEENEGIQEEEEES